MPQNDPVNNILRDPGYSQQVDPEFQRALKGAVDRFRRDKAPLWQAHLDQIAIMEKVVNNNHQTNRELRDKARAACREINGWFRNWFVSSLLADYIEEVLSQPAFNVEALYEAVIDHLGQRVKLQDVLIAQLEQENEKLKKDPNADLIEKITHGQSMIARLEKKLDVAEKTIAHATQTNIDLRARLELYDANYNNLYASYLQAEGGKQPPLKKQFTAPLPPLPTTTSASKVTPFKAELPHAVSGSPSYR